MEYLFHLFRRSYEAWDQFLGFSKFFIRVIFKPQPNFPVLINLSFLFVILLLPLLMKLLRLFPLFCLPFLASFSNSKSQKVYTQSLHIFFSPFIYQYKSNSINTYVSLIPRINENQILSPSNINHKPTWAKPLLSKNKQMKAPKQNIQEDYKRTVEIWTANWQKIHTSS